MEALSKNKLKFIRQLRLKKNRNSERLFVVEGEKIVKELIEKHSNLLVEILALPSFFDEITAPSNTTCIQLDSKELSQISELKTPNKAIALVKFLQFDITQESFSLVLDRIQDPGNLGTIIRLADWYGLKEIICSNDTVDCYNQKVIQASMGSIFRVKVTYTDIVDFLKNDSRPKLGAALGGSNVYKTQLSNHSILVMGNEGNGLSDAVKEQLTQELEIPRKGEAESLNVSIATAIFLSEFFRSI